MTQVDLHTHSTKSDGSYTPTELVEYAIEKGLAAIALTDHDTTEGIDEAIAAAAGRIEVIPGIEFSSSYEGQDIHVVGLFLDYKGEFFQRKLEDFVNARTIRNIEMCRRLTDHGMPVTYEELVEMFPDSVITRAHYAKLLMAKGYTKSIKEAFDRFIGDHGPCFVPRKQITPMRAVEIILKAGGVPVLAHPCLYHMSDARLDKLVSTLKDMGLVGIEAIYSTYTAGEERQIRALAKKYDLLISGGSDFHGNAKPGLDLGVGYGKLYVPGEVLENIRERHEEMMSNPSTIKKTKILFTDLDGTLLNSDKQISEYTRDVLNTWSKAGHKIVLCSGRDTNSIKSVKEYLHLDFPGMYIVGYNGSDILECDTGKTLYCTGLNYEQVMHILEVANEHGVHMHTYSDTHILTPRQDEEIEYYSRVIKTPVIISKDLHELQGTTTCKCLAIELHNKEKMEGFRKALLPWCEENKLTMFYSNPYYLEFCPLESGKGSAVRRLCEILNIPIALSVAAGDEQNDLSMIEAAGVGIGMKNGIEAVRMAATTITREDNDHDGLALALRDLI